MFGWLEDFIENQITARLLSWTTTVPGVLLAFIDGIASHFIDPNYLHHFDQQVAQWLIAGLSLVLLAWKDRKEPPVDYTPTQPPERDK